MRAAPGGTRVSFRSPEPVMSAESQALGGVSEPGLMLECEGVWKLFGHGAERFLDERSASGTR